MSFAKPGKVVEEEKPRAAEINIILRLLDYILEKPHFRVSKASQQNFSHRLLTPKTKINSIYNYTIKTLMPHVFIPTLV